MGLSPVSAAGLSVPGTAGNDTLVVTATSADTGSYVLNGGVAVPFAGIDAFSFDGGGGNDLLRINNPAGNLFGPVNGIEYDGGGQNADALENLGGTATSSSYTGGPAAKEGTIRNINGPVTQVIHFTGLAPVTDTVVAANLTILATNSANVINYNQGSLATNGLVAIDEQETYEFSNKATLVLNGNGGDDEINLNNPATPTALTSITVNGGDPSGSTGDSLTINGVPGSQDNIRNTPTGAGSGIVVNDGTPQPNVTYNGLEQLHISVELNDSDGVRQEGTTGDDSIAYDVGAIGDRGTFRGLMDQNNATGNGPFVMTETSFTGASVAANDTDVNFFNPGGTDTLVFNTDSRDDAIVVAGGEAGGIQVSDTINNLTMARLELFNVANINVHSNGGTDSLSYNATAPTVTVNLPNSLTGVGGATASFDGIESVNLAATNLIVNGTPVNDTLNFTLPSSVIGSFINVPQGLPFNYTVGGTITVNGGSGNNSLGLYGDDAVNASTLTATTASLNGANLTLGSGISRVNFNTLGGNDTLSVQDTTRDATLNGGSGNDTFSIDSNGAAAGGTVDNVTAALTINGGGGEDSLTLEDSSDASDDTVTVTPTQVGANLGDTFFGLGGSLAFSDLDIVTLNAGTGATGDTIHLTPATATQFSINGNNPTTLPGDSLLLDLSGTSQASLQNTGVGAGTWTFSNRQPVSFTGIETTNQLPSISIDDVTVTEGDSGSTAATFTLTLSAASTQPVSVSYATSDATAQAPGDYTSRSGTVTFDPGQTTRTVTVPVNGDTLAEDDETFFVDLSNPSNATLADGQGLGTITDNDPDVLGLTITPNIFSEGAGAAAATGTVTRTGPTVAALVVTLTNTDAGEANVPATVTIPIGQASATFPVDAVDDAVVDGPQSVTVTASAGGLISDSEQVTVLDDDGPTLTLNIVPGSLSENGGTATATVSRNTNTASALTVLLQSSDNDEAAVPATVTIPAGQTSTTFTVTGVDNFLAEGTRSVTITSSASGFNAAAATVNLTDDDTAALSLSLAPTEVVEGGTASGTVRRNTPTTTPLTVQLSRAPVGAATVPAQVIIPAGAAAATFAIATTDDTVVNGSRTVTISASAGGLVAANAGLTITDNDVPPPPDPAAPQVSIRIPGANEILSRLRVVSGTATGLNATDRSKTTVDVYLQRLSDEAYWDGHLWSDSATPLPVTVVGTGWILTTGVLPAPEDLDDGLYRVTAVATDTLGQTGRAIVNFRLDQTAPQVSFVLPKPNQVLSTVRYLLGRAVDAPGGAGISRVTLFLRRLSDGRFWNGTAWVTAPSGLSTTLSGGSWLRNSGLPSGSNLPDGQYRLQAIADDAAGHRAINQLVFLVGTLTGGQNQAVRYSSGAASVARQLVRLNFTGALDVVSVQNGTYEVTVNGDPVTVADVRYDNVGIVSLQLDEGSFEPGDTLQVGWRGLHDVVGNVVPDGVATLTAR